MSEVIRLTSRHTIPVHVSPTLSTSSGPQTSVPSLDSHPSLRRSTVV